jgi:hypothetical protein
MTEIPMKSVGKILSTRIDSYGCLANSCPANTLNSLAPLNSQFDNKQLGSRTMDPCEKL